MIDDKNVCSYQCTFKFKNEEICGRCFNRQKDFNKHMMKSLQHEETPMPSGTAFVCSNQCPWCHRVFNNNLAAESHVTRAFKAGKCQNAKIKDKNLMMRGQRIKSDDICFLKFCEVNFDNLEEYNKHVSLHGKPGSGLFLQPRYLSTLQDVAAEYKILL